MPPSVLHLGTSTLRLLPLALLALGHGVLGQPVFNPNFGQVLWQSPNYSNMSLSLVGVDVSGRIYALDAVMGTFVQFDATGTFLQRIPAQRDPAMPNITYTSTLRPAVDPNGTVLVSVITRNNSLSNSTVVVYSVAQNTVLYTWNITVVYKNQTVSVTPFSLVVDGVLRVVMTVWINYMGILAMFSINGTALGGYAGGIGFDFLQVDHSSNIFLGSVEPHYITGSPPWQTIVTEVFSNGSVSSALSFYSPNVPFQDINNMICSFIDDFGVVYSLWISSVTGSPSLAPSIANGGTINVVVPGPQVSRNGIFDFFGGWQISTDSCGDIIAIVQSLSIVKMRGASYTAPCAVPQLNGMSSSSTPSTFSAVTSSSSTVTRSSTSTSTSSTNIGSLCLLMYGLPGTIDYPWSVSTSMQVTFSPTLVTNSIGTAALITGGNGTRTFTNRFGSAQVTAVTVAPVNTMNSNNLLYLGGTYPVDSNGITWNLAAPTQLPGKGPSQLYSQVNIFNQSGIVVESNVFRIDGMGSAFLSTVPGFMNVAIGASNINALAANYATCQAPITFTNGLRAPTQPSASNGAIHFTYIYSISDGATYTVSGNLTFTCTSSFANNHDALGNPYQIVANVTGTRTYTYLVNGQQIISTVSGLSTSANAYADQRWYPYALLSATPGLYQPSTAPFLDANGVEFNIYPPAPLNGMAPGTGTQYNATTIYFTTPEPVAVLTEGYCTNLPLVQYQVQTYTLLS